MAEPANGKMHSLLLCKKSYILKGIYKEKHIDKRIKFKEKQVFLHFFFFSFHIDVVNFFYICGTKLLHL